MSKRREFWLCAGYSFDSYQEAIAFMHGVDRTQSIVHVREVLPGDDDKWSLVGTEARLEELEQRHAKLVELIAPWFSDEPGVIQELAGTKYLQIPMADYRKIQAALDAEVGDESV